MVTFRTIILSLFLSPLLTAALPTSTTPSDSLLLPGPGVAKRAPQPSMARRGLHKKDKRSANGHMLGNKKDYSAFLCPGAESLALAAPTGTNTAASGAESASVLKACPAPGTGIAGDLVEGMSPEELSRQMNGLADWFRVGFECVDFQVDVKNCGGCAAFGTGQDCSALPFSVRSTCAQGSCNVISCEQGYVVAPDKTSCIARNDRGTEPILEEEEEERLLRESDAQKVVGRLR